MPRGWLASGHALRSVVPCCCCASADAIRRRSGFRSFLRRSPSTQDYPGEGSQPDARASSSPAPTPSAASPGRPAAHRTSCASESTSTARSRLPYTQSRCLAVRHGYFDLPQQVPHLLRLVLLASSHTLSLSSVSLIHWHISSRALQRKRQPGLLRKGSARYQAPSRRMPELLKLDNKKPQCDEQREDDCLRAVDRLKRASCFFSSLFKLLGLRGLPQTRVGSKGQSIQINSNSEERYGQPKNGRLIYEGLSLLGERSVQWPSGFLSYSCSLQAVQRSSAQSFHLIRFVGKRSTNV